MKKSDELRLRTRKMIAKNLIILVALAVVAFVGAYSWFVKSQTATASGISVETIINDKLEYYIMPPSDSDQYAAINRRLNDNATWNEEHKDDDDYLPRRTEWHQGDLSFDFSDQELKFMSGLYMSEVTGDGTSFKLPVLWQYENVAYINTEQEFSEAVANDDYMSFDLYFRVNTDANDLSVTMGHDSKIEPKDKISISGTRNYDGSVEANEELMKPGAIGAVRLAVLNFQANIHRELLWIPGPNVWYDGKNDVLYTGLTEAGTNPYNFNHGSAYYDGNGIEYRDETTTDHAFFTSNIASRTVWHDGGSEGVKASKSGNYQLGANSTEDITVTTLNQHDETNGYYYGRVRINLWIEGEDAEARLKMVNGKFDMSLKFDIAE